MKQVYNVVFEPGESGWILARVPEIPGAFSQGRTMAEAREMIADAVQLLLEVRLQDARAGTSGQAVWDTLAVELPTA